MAVPSVQSKAWILALFIRDDNQRFLLGSGAYEFKEDQLHFAANNYVNDVVEIQGNDGQLLAGQVRRAAVQTFDGYVGDATIGQSTIEQYRRDFFAFFQKNHFYTVVYVMCDGSAIQRRRGYIVDAPEVRELWQLFPEYHVALNFEDVNYYTYAEDDDGKEIFSNYATIPTSAATIGGLVWAPLSQSRQTWQEGTNLAFIQTIEDEEVQHIDLKGQSYQESGASSTNQVPVQNVAGVQTITLTDGIINSNSYTVDLGSIELCKIGDMQDYIYEQNGSFFLHKEIKTATAPVGDNDITINDMVLDSEFYSTAGGTISGNTITFDDLLEDETTIYYQSLTPDDTEITDANLVAELTTLSAAKCYDGVTTFTSSAEEGYLPAIMTVYLDIYAGGGVEWDSYGAVWEAGGGSQVTTVTNNSITNVAPTITITGVSENPSVTNLTTNQTLTYTGNITATQTLVINVARRTALLNGASVISKISGDWPLLAPGNNRLTYTTDNPTVPDAQIEWQEVVG